MKAAKKVALVGNPNVGKSALFNVLTGANATVSNYPGTTVTLTRGTTAIGGVVVEVIDTPGMYSFLSITEEERVARSILIDEDPDLILHVADARNLRRMLVLTLELIEAGLPVVLILNMMDEAQSAGITIDLELLEQELGIKVAATVATKRTGIEALRRLIANHNVENVENHAVS